MDDSDPLLPIGDLARLTGLTVKTVRFYSDRGLVPPAARTAAGYRRYGPDAVARLEFVRTLRELGMDLATVGRIVDGVVPLSHVAAEHAAALDLQIGVLRRRRAVLAAVARRALRHEELTLMHQLAGLSGEERGWLFRAFLDEVFDGFAADPAYTGVMRSLSPHLPDDAAPERVQAWVELAELSQDPGFRGYLRTLVVEDAADRARAKPAAGVVRRDLAATVGALVAPAVAAGVAPDSERAAPYVAALDRGCADFLPPRLDGSDERRARLRRRVVHLDDPRREQYTRLLATVNGWPPPPSLAPVLRWTARALEAAPAA